ncbi:MAG TPA: hypothetical protein VD886_14855 [Herpetosiphonaceae bacterium]|nr:hypothetical protein [Herpetosiphonaceae bacterium]
MSGAAGRLGQLWRALSGRVSATDEDLARRSLPPAEYALYARMPRRDRRHCLDVHARLIAAGVDDPLLLRAALFHDTGKVDPRGRPVPLLWYGGLVVFKRLWPRAYARLAASPRSWRRFFFYYAHHGPLGAELARAAGSPPEIQAILRHYHDDAPAGRAAILKRADEGLEVRSQESGVRIQIFQTSDV